MEGLHVPLDDRNWECPAATLPDGEIIDKIEMRDGKLFQRYWAERRNFETRRSLKKK